MPRHHNPFMCAHGKNKFNLYIALEFEEFKEKKFIANFRVITAPYKATKEHEKKNQCLSSKGSAKPMKAIIKNCSLLSVGIS